MVNTGAGNRRTRREGAPQGLARPPPSPGDASTGDPPSRHLPRSVQANLVLEKEEGRDSARLIVSTPDCAAFAWAAGQPHALPPNPAPVQGQPRRCFSLGQLGEHAAGLPRSLGHTSSRLCSPRSLWGRSEERCRCCCCGGGGWEGRRLSQAHVELQTCGSAKH